MWEGGEVWIIGGGPSVPAQFGVPSDIIEKVLSKELDPSAYSPYMKRLHNQHVIGVNIAYLIGAWIDMVFFGDKRWYYQNRDRLAKFPGLKVSCHPHLKHEKFQKENIKYLSRDRQKGRGISSNRTAVCWNANSGAAAISVAAHAGAKRIVLLGFDMKLEDNKHHWHGLYRPGGRAANSLPFHRHLPGFKQIAKDARQKGIEIINASPNSTIEDLPKMSVKEVFEKYDTKTVSLVS